jgi:hypothetical protein
VLLAPLVEDVRDRPLRALAALADLLTAGLNGVGGFEARRGESGGGLARMESCCIVCDRLAASLAPGGLFVDDAPLAVVGGGGAPFDAIAT